MSPQSLTETLAQMLDIRIRMRKLAELGIPREVEGMTKFSPETRTLYLEIWVSSRRIVTIAEDLQKKIEKHI